MSCEDIPSLLDLQKAKKDVDDLGRLMGAGAGTSTNGNTGQVRPTYNKVIEQLGFKPGSGDFTTGFTVMPGERDIAWYNSVDKNWYSYLGVIPSPSGYVVAPMTDPTIGGSWKPVTNNILAPTVRELTRRSYAESGLNLVGGSFQAGFTIVNANDVALDEATGKVFSGVAGTYPAGTSTVGFSDRSGDLIRIEISGAGGAGMVGTDNGTVQERLSALDSEIVVLTENTNTALSGDLWQKAQHGFSKEDGGESALGSNHISTMRPSDASSVTDPAGFNLAGEFVGAGVQNLAAWPLNAIAASFVCQARLYWNASVDNSFIGYNSSTTVGGTDFSTFYSIGFTSVGFVFSDKVSFQTLVPAASLTEGLYEITFVYNSGLLFASICRSGETKAKSFPIIKTLPSPVNAQIGVYSSGDRIRDFRFCSTKAKNPWAPPAGIGASIPMPLTIPAINPSGVAISVHLPAGYDPRITHRLAVYCHGSSGTNTDLWDYPNENTVLTALLSAGYVVMVANYGTTSWGNQSSVTQNKAAIQYIMDRYNLFNLPYFVVQSMGGMVGMNTILVGGVKPAAVAGIYPATNLRWQYDNGFTAAIEGAYGFSGAANFDAATAGYDVLNDNAPEEFANLRMKFWHSPADTVVSKAQNTDLLKLKVDAGGGRLDVVVTSGDHGDPSSFDGAGIVEFFNRN